ncbi:MAG: hypothetical protein HY898_25705 [Deltaproteobacteria bacterium]|nr:hypothetical protein [Deltaproteobacteria bacterium]
MRCLSASLGIVVVALTVAACSGSTEQTPGGAGGSSAAGGGAGSGGTGGTGGAGGTGGGAATGGSAGLGGGGAGGSADAGPCPAQEPWFQACQSPGQMCSYTLCGKDSTCTCQGGNWNCTQVDCADIPPPMGCPPDVPTGWCQQPNLQCWYGDDPRPWCRQTATCLQGQWSVTAAKCVGPTSNCPADPKNPPDGVCGNTDPMFCTYGPGYGCDCEWNGGVPPPDGGPNLQWTCFEPPGNGCPDVAPNVGQSCNVPAGKQCIYGPTCSSYFIECEKGVWVLKGQSACA